MPTSMIVQHSALSQERKLVPGPLTCNLRPPAVRPQATKLPDAPTRDCSPCSSRLFCQNQGSQGLISPRDGEVIWPSMPQPCPLIASHPTPGRRGVYPYGQGTKAMEGACVSKAGPACGPWAFKGVLLGFFPILASSPGPQVLPSSPLSSGEMASPKSDPVLS